MKTSNRTLQCAGFSPQEPHETLIRPVDECKVERNSLIDDDSDVLRGGIVLNANGLKLGFVDPIRVSRQMEMVVGTLEG